MKSLLLLKALSDESRLSIFRLLLERDAYSEVIAERLKLAPSTVSFHLKKLTDAGLVTSFRDQYYVIYKANPAIAKMTLRSLILEAELKDTDQGEDQYREKALKSFFKYGKLIKIPAQKIKRQWVLERVAKSFHEHKSYTMIEAEKVLSEVFGDPALLIKELKQLGLIRVADGKISR